MTLTTLNLTEPSLCYMHLRFAHNVVLYKCFDQLVRLETLNLTQDIKCCIYSLQMQSAVSSMLLHHYLNFDLVHQKSGIRFCHKMHQCYKLYIW